MTTITAYQDFNIIEKINVVPAYPIHRNEEKDQSLEKMLAELSPNTPWGIRKMAAQKIGLTRNSKALPGLLRVLVTDSFWMVRCSIIQAIERIGDSDAIPVLQEVALKDSFQVVRSYATKAVERLSDMN